MYATADRTLCKSCATACSEKDARAPDRGRGGGGAEGFPIKGPKDDLTGVPQHLRGRRCRGPQRMLGTPSSHPSPTGRRSVNDQMPLARGVRVSTETRIVLLSQVDLWGEQPCGRRSTGQKDAHAHAPSTPTRATRLWHQIHLLNHVRGLKCKIRQLQRTPSVGGSFLLGDNKCLSAWLRERINNTMANDQKHTHVTGTNAQRTGSKTLTIM